MILIILILYIFSYWIVFFFMRFSPEEFYEKPLVSIKRIKKKKYFIISFSLLIAIFQIIEHFLGVFFYLLILIFFILNILLVFYDKFRVNKKNIKKLFFFKYLKSCFSLVKIVCDIMIIVCALLLV